MMKPSIVVICLVSSLACAGRQNAEYKVGVRSGQIEADSCNPGWTRALPDDLRFAYFRGLGYGLSDAKALDSARSMVEVELLRQLYTDRKRETEIVVRRGSVEENRLIDRSRAAGLTNGLEERAASYNCITPTGAFRVWKLFRLERKVYDLRLEQATKLYQDQVIKSNPAARDVFNPPPDRQELVMNAIWNPGIAQFRQGRNTLGNFGRWGTIFGVVGGATTLLMARHESDNSDTQTTQTLKDYYYDRAQRRQIASWAFFSLASVAYISQLIDAGTYQASQK